MAKLERDGKRHEINVRSQDQFEFWQSDFSGDCWNITLKDGQGEDVLRLYSVYPDQLATLSTSIAEVLGRAPDLTRHHLVQLRDELTRLIGADETTEVDLENLDF